MDDESQFSGLGTAFEHGVCMKHQISLASHTLESILEHRFLADCGSILWSRGIYDFEVLHAESDNAGYDLVIEANGFVRHIQLKSMVTGGTRSRINVHRALANKPSGCVIWIIYNLEDLSAQQFLWFGGKAGESLPDIGDRSVKHSRANSDGVKAIRPALRNIPKGWFDKVATMEELVAMLFQLDPAGGNQVQSADS